VLAASCGATPPAGIEEPLAVQEGSPDSLGTPTPEPEADPAAIARDFWLRLAARDNEAAVALASYPFDLDAHNGCIEDAAGLKQALADDPLPADFELVVGQARPVAADMDVSGLDPHWHGRIRNWAGPEAACLGAPTVDGTAVEYHYFLVGFTVNGEPVGAITRVRCVRGACGVAGTEN